MATRSFISRKTTVGYEGVYCHWDGYPDGVGAQLMSTFSDKSTVSGLLSHGDMSSMDTGTVEYYDVERGRPRRYKSLKTMLRIANQMGCDYLYVFDPPTWLFARITDESEPEQLSWTNLADIL